MALNKNSIKRELNLLNKVIKNTEETLDYLRGRKFDLNESINNELNNELNNQLNRYVNIPVGKSNHSVQLTLKEFENIKKEVQNKKKFTNEKMKTLSPADIYNLYESLKIYVQIPVGKNSVQFTLKEFENIKKRVQYKKKFTNEQMKKLSPTSIYNLYTS